MTVGELAEKITEVLKKAGVKTPAFECGVICEDAAGLPRGAAGFMPDEPVRESAAARALDAAERRAAGEPLQYISGRWEFWGLPFIVGPGVLIPRPETELLVETVLARVSGKRDPVVVDLCSGSGCVAVALAGEMPSSRIFALEKSPEAFAYLKKNIELNRARNVIPILADVLSFGGGLPELDCLAANPPYVRSGEIDSLQRELSYEPRMALDGGGDGLALYRGIAAGWGRRIRRGGLAAFEIGENQGGPVSEILEAEGFSEIAVKNDYAGLPRVVIAVR